MMKVKKMKRAKMKTITDDDIVLCEVGNSSADESTSDEDIGPMPRTRAGRTVTTYMTRRYFGDSD